MRKKRQPLGALGQAETERRVFPGLRLISDQRGFTVAELIAALIVSSIISLAIYGSYFVSSKSFEVQEETVNIQQEARIAMLNLEQDIRQAGSVFGFLPEQEVRFLDHDPNTGRLTDQLTVFGIQSVGRFWPDDTNGNFCFERLNVFPIEGWAFSGGNGLMLLNINKTSLGCPDCACNSRLLDRITGPEGAIIPLDSTTGDPGTHFLIVLSGPAVGGAKRCTIVETTDVTYDPTSGPVPEEGDDPADYLLIGFRELQAGSEYLAPNEFCTGNNSNLDIIARSGRFPVSVGGGVFASGGEDISTDSYTAYTFSFGGDTPQPGASTIVGAEYGVELQEIPAGSDVWYSLLLRNGEILLRGIEDIQFAFLDKTGGQIQEHCGPGSVNPCVITPQTLGESEAVRVSMVLTEEQKENLMRHGHRQAQRARTPTSRLDIENRVWEDADVPPGDEFFVRRVYTSIVNKRN